jgi:hypothetical protein
MGTSHPRITTGSPAQKIGIRSATINALAKTIMLIPFHFDWSGSPSLSESLLHHPVDATQAR